MKLSSSKFGTKFSGLGTPVLLSGLLLMTGMSRANADGLWLSAGATVVSQTVVKSTGSSAVVAPNSPSVTASSTFSDEQGEYKESADVSASYTIHAVCSGHSSGTLPPLQCQYALSVNGSTGPATSDAPASATSTATAAQAISGKAPLNYQFSLLGPAFTVETYGSSTFDLNVSASAHTDAYKTADDTGDPPTHQETTINTSTATGHAQVDISISGGGTEA